MTRSFFGTDGIRGTANLYPMTAEIALKCGQAAGSFFQNGGHKHRVVIGKDTRLSGYMIEPALTSGFISVGMDVVLVGPMPTPAVAMLTRSLRADLGVMISASHNPFNDNGIKLFDRNGLKLSDLVESQIEALMHGDMTTRLAHAEKLGRAKRLDDAPGRYIEFAKHTFPRRKSLSGMKIVLDCGHGAAYHIGKTIFWELGADVIELGVQPDGFNINQGCGSTAPQLLCDAVRVHEADLGIALDGDADRLIICDEKGHVVDGDQLIGVIANYQKKTGRLQGGGVVATHMSNLGLEYYLKSLNLSLIRTQVGDRYVADYMRTHGYNVGGEQSGHIILRDYTTTGDGIIAALQILAVLVDSDMPASELCRVFEPVPQILKNVRYRDGSDPLEHEKIKRLLSQMTESMV